MSLAHVDLDGAWRHNPLIFIFFGGSLLVDLYAAAVLLFGLPRLRLAKLPSKIKSAVGALLIIALTANWIYLLANRWWCRTGHDKSRADIVLFGAKQIYSLKPKTPHCSQCEIRAVAIAAEVPEDDSAKAMACDRRNQFCGVVVWEMAVPGQYPLFDRPRASGVFLKHPLVVISFDN
jgi:hypothetical protein